MDIIIALIFLGVFAYGVGIIIGVVKGVAKGAGQAHRYYARKKAEEQK